ncbi:DHHA1 domain-containing protein, partial [Streptomyces lasiicapitis]|uniref:DHHA1 domain-containing protein n=1 Tax=Streptomyces lasiicapitis TaxID=1923961 RepID=UPI0036600F9E
PPHPGRPTRRDPVLRGLGGCVAAGPGPAPDGKVILAAAVSPALHRAGIEASQLLTDAARTVGGGSGGRGPVASAGGRDPQVLLDALAAATRAASQLL